MNTITLEEGLLLFRLPRSLGETPDGEPVSVGIGRFGPYVRFGSKFASIGPDDDPYQIGLERALSIIDTKKKADAARHIKSFEGSEVQILNGRYGPYVTDRKKNARVPKGRDPSELTLEECRELLDAAPARRRRGAWQEGKIMNDRRSFVAVMMGSDSDWPVMQSAVEVLRRLEVATEVRIASAHRTPATTSRYVEEASGRGCAVFIAGAGMAAHLAGAVAAHTNRPVIGVPLESGPLAGMDALLSTVQMPPGFPGGHGRGREGRRHQRRVSRGADTGALGPGAREPRCRGPGGTGPRGSGQERCVAARARLLNLPGMCAVAVPVRALGPPAHPHGRAWSPGAAGGSGTGVDEEHAGLRESVSGCRGRA